MKYLDELTKLGLPKNQFAIFGSGPMGIRGLRECDDLDIIVKPDLWNKLKDKYSSKNENEKCIKIGNIEIFKEWLPWFSNIEELIKEAETINGFPFVKLERVLEWKRQFNRKKDKKDIKIIINYLNNQK